MKLAIRVDSSVEIGIGHVMRCLTLANSLRKIKIKVSFICCEYQGNHVDFIKSKGYKVYSFPASKTLAFKDKNRVKIQTLGRTQIEDAELCRKVVKDERFNWIVVDHYAINEVWHMQVEDLCDKLMVIDDLCNRNYKCDILLDQTFGRKKTDYKGLVPNYCNILTGSRYVLLRPDFIKLRSYSLSRRNTYKFQKLFISMGGVDNDNLICRILDVINHCELPKNIEIIVVLGSTSPHIELVKKHAKENLYNVDVKVDVDNMAYIMAKSDLAIGAAGTTTWERCCLGLPSLLIVLSDNQKTIADSLGISNAVKVIHKHSDIKKIISNIKPQLNKISLISSSIIQENGVMHVVNAIVKNQDIDSELELTPATVNDSDFIYSLQTNNNRKYFVNPAVPSKDKHHNWYMEAIDSPNTVIFIVNFEDRNKVGMLRLDGLELGNELELSVIIMKRHSGKGYARFAVQKLLDLLINRDIKSVIHRENIASKKLFEKIGFVQTESDKNFDTYRMLNT